MSYLDSDLDHYTWLNGEEESDSSEELLDWDIPPICIHHYEVGECVQCYIRYEEHVHVYSEFKGRRSA